MIDITPYSLLWVNVVSGIFIAIYVIITHNKRVICKIPIWITVLFTIVISLRLLFPIEFLKISHTFISYNFLPPIDDAMHKNLSLLLKSFSFNLSFAYAFCLIWGVGTVILLLNYFIRYYKLCKIIKFTPQLDNNYIEILNRLKNENNFNFKTKLIYSSAVEFPAECGYFSQTIFINAYNYTEDELSYILLHELAHFKYGTNWINLFINVLNIIFWWNPIIYIYKKYINNIVEIYVDSKVTKDMNDLQKCNYIKCIFKVSEIVSNSDTSNLKYVTPLIKSNSDKLLLNRFNIIKYKKKVSIPICISIFLLIFAYMFVSSKYVLQPGWKPPANEVRNMDISEFTPENSYIVWEDGKYILYYNNESFLIVEDLNEFKNVPYIKK